MAAFAFPFATAAHVPAADSSWIAELTFKVHEPTLLHESSEGKRLIKKVTAYRDGVEFWTQVFYRSTGRNSTYPDIWFPFLGISTKDGRSYYSKDISTPLTWPDEDKLKTKGPEFGLFRQAPVDLAQRFVTRSFLLGSNAISALYDEEDKRRFVMNNILFVWEIHPEHVDVIIKDIIIKNTLYKDFKEEYSLKASSEMEINKFIAKDIYINYGKDKKINLSTMNDLPDYWSLSSLFGGRRARKQTRRRRVAQRRTRRRGYGRR
jgi:hypothetical protein